MRYTRESIRRIAQDSEISRISSIELPITSEREDFYHAGPPTLIYTTAPNGIEYRVRLLDLHGINSNEVKYHPDRFYIRVPGPLPRAPLDDRRAILTGELVRVPNITPRGRKDLPASESRQLTGGMGGTGAVTRINLGGSEISLSENGKIDLESYGDSVLTADGRTITAGRDIVQYSLCGGMSRVLVKENMIANLVPTTLVTPLPIYKPDFSFLDNGREVIQGTIELVMALR